MKDDIEKIDKQIELLKKDKDGKNIGVEKVVSEINDSEDENHVINISYIDSEVKENTKEIKNLNNIMLEDTIENEEKELSKEKIINEKVNNSNNKNENKSNKSNKSLFIILSIIIGVLFVILIVLLFVFNSNKKEENDNNKVINNEEEKNELSKSEMSKIIDLYGKSLEKEIVNYFNQNNKLPDFSTVNNLVDLDYEVVCFVREIYEDKTIYLNECMIDYKEVDYSYGVKQEIKEVVVDNNNIKVYVHKNTKKATLEEPVNKEEYYLYSSNVDSEIENLSLLDGTSYLTYYDISKKTHELYNYIVGRRAFHNVDYSYASIIYRAGDVGVNKTSEYVVLHLNNSKARLYNLFTGNPIGDEYDGISNHQIVNDRIMVYNEKKYGVMNIKTGELVIPIEYDNLINSGSSIVGEKDKKTYILDSDGNSYLEDELSKIFNVSYNHIYDKYVLLDKRILNLSGKEICEFETENKFLVQRNRVVDNKLIFYILEYEKNKEMCFIYDISQKECSIHEKSECQ